MARASKKKFEEQCKSIKEDIRKYATEVGVRVATKIRDELTDTAIFAMEQFYKDYTPIYYKRHWNVHNFINTTERMKVRSIKKFYINSNNNFIRGGVLLSPDADAKQYKQAMLDVYGSAKYPAPPYEVFDLVMHGFHGPASYGLHVYKPETWARVRRMQPSPLDIVYAKRDFIVKNIDKYIKDAKKIVGKKYDF